MTQSTTTDRQGSRSLMPTGREHRSKYRHRKESAETMRVGPGGLAIGEMRGWFAIKLGRLKLNVAMKVLKTRCEPANKRLTSLGRTPYLCRSENAMIQQVTYLIGRWGFRFYSMVTIPEGKEPSRVDAKLFERLNLGESQARADRGGEQVAAKVRYLRFNRWGILLATHGVHPFFQAESYKDCRVHPIGLFGYSVGYYRHQKAGRGPVWNATVNLAERQFFTLKSALVSIACEPEIATTMRKLPVLPYAGVRTQLFKIRTAVNEAREAEGLEPLDYSALPPLKRKSLKVFVALHSNAGGPA